MTKKELIARIMKEPIRRKRKRAFAIIRYRPTSTIVHRHGRNGRGKRRKRSS